MIPQELAGGIYDAGMDLEREEAVPIGVVEILVLVVTTLVAAVLGGLLVVGVLNVLDHRQTQGSSRQVTGRR